MLSVNSVRANLATRYAYKFGRIEIYFKQNSVSLRIRFTNPYYLILQKCLEIQDVEVSRRRVPIFAKGGNFFCRSFVNIFGRAFHHIRLFHFANVNLEKFTWIACLNRTISTCEDHWICLNIFLFKKPLICPNTLLRHWEISKRYIELFWLQRTDLKTFLHGITPHLLVMLGLVVDGVHDDEREVPVVDLLLERPDKRTAISLLHVFFVNVL